ncbi:MAG: RnfABCDGE type electron transport complex subunit G [Proteobacteria bacterium]|nr:RnfABCDGE type electron transport complex subunit G [Pseudomonadota bacterium]
MHDRIWYMAVVLGTVGFVAGLALAGVKSMTDPIIEKRTLEQKIKPTLDEVFKPAGVDNDYITDRVKLELGRDDKGRAQRLTVFRGRKGEKLVAAALITSSPGYGGDITVLTAFDLENKKLLDVKTLQHKETKWGGARTVDDSDPFIKQWTGMDYENGFALSADGGQVDAMSGATISSAAFTRALNRAVKLLAEHGDKIRED